MPWMRGDSLFDVDVRNNFETIIAELEAIRGKDGEDVDPDAEDPAAAFWETLLCKLADPADVATKLLLTSPSSVGSNPRSPQAGPSQADLWHIKSITPSILAFVCIVVHFVLSGDKSFELATRTANYMNIYSDTLELLRIHCHKHRVLHDKLIERYN
ncbi:hypothetical protein FRC06_007084, partial [Ceratobasidium sp. 370]